MRSALLLASVALAAAATVATAQERESDAPLRPVRSIVGGNFYYAKPVGEFADRIDQGWGGSLHGTFLFSPEGPLGIRFDAGYMGYGRERTRECLTSSCLIEVDITTSNNLAWIGAGPELVAPRGPVRPYIAGQIGWTWLWTSSSAEGSDNDNQSFASTTNFHDNTFSYGGVTGLLIPVAVGRTPVSLDLGARYLRNGRVEYLREGDIIVNPGSVPTFNVQRSRADLMTFFVGVSVGLR